MKLDWLCISILLCTSLTLDSAIILSTCNLFQSSATCFIVIHLQHIDLENSCLTKEEKKEVMEMLYKYREAFSLRGEIGKCPNIEVEFEFTDKSPIF